MTRIRMLTNTYDEYQGFLRCGDEKNVPTETALRWEKNKIALIISSPEEVTEVAAETTVEEFVDEVSNELNEQLIDESATEKPASVDYNTMTRKELIELANMRGIETTRATKTATIIERLEA